MQGVGQSRAAACSTSQLLRASPPLPDRARFPTAPKVHLHQPGGSGYPQGFEQRARDGRDWAWFLVIVTWRLAPKWPFPNGPATGGRRRLRSSAASTVQHGATMGCLNDKHAACSTSLLLRLPVSAVSMCSNKRGSRGYSIASRRRSDSRFRPYCGSWEA